MHNENKKRRNRDSTLPLNVAALLVVGATFALGHVWLDMQGEAIGTRIKQLENERNEFQKRYDNALWSWERTISPSNIDEALKQHNIVMVWPGEMNIVRLEQPDSSIASLQDIASQVIQVAQSGRISPND